MATSPSLPVCRDCGRRSKAIRDDELEMFAWACIERFGSCPECVWDRLERERF